MACCLVLSTVVAVWRTVVCCGTVLVRPSLALPEESRGSLSTLLTTVVAVKGWRDGGRVGVVVWGGEGWCVAVRLEE